MPGQSIEYEVLCRASSACYATWMARLPHAPFPYDGRVGDSDLPFFDHVDPVSGQRMHTVSERIAYPESPHYRDNRVLIHLPPAFKPDRPFEILLFFHGHQTELQRTLVEEMALLQQLNGVGRNLMLVAPQMALDAADSTPGKFYRPQGVQHMFQDLSWILEREMGKPFARRMASAPVVLAAYSGGYRALAYTLDRGFSERAERDKRLRGVILLDALYGEWETFAEWLSHPGRRGFFVNLYGSTTEPLSVALQEKLKTEEIPWSNTLQKRSHASGIYFLPVETPHPAIILMGPPPWPLVEILKQVGSPAAL